LNQRVAEWKLDATVEAPEASLLEPGLLRERFAVARREAARPRRWLGDLVGHVHESEQARRIAELDARSLALDERERALVRREEALARWFAELSRMQRVLGERA
jgi:hypothetical protein